MMMSRCSFTPVPVADEIMLFGVRVKLDPMRKSVSMNNLSEYELPYQELTNSAAAGATGYASADDVVHHQSTPSRERKRGVPWTEDEHKLFLLGLQKVGKGDWRGISRNFVKSRTPTQVASHAQKYFLRKSNLNRRRRRSSLFDITTDSVTTFSMEEEHVHQDNVMQLSEAPNTGGFPVTPYPGSVGPILYPLHSENPSGNRTAGFTGEVNNASSTLLGSVTVLPLFKSPAPRLAVEFDKTLTRDDPTVSLNLSLSFGHHDHLSSRHSVYQVPQDFSNRDAMIGVV